MPMPAATASMAGRVRRASPQPPRVMTRPALKVRFDSTASAIAVTACPADQAVQLGFEIQQDGSGDAQHHGQGAVAELDGGAEAEADQDGDDGGGARIAGVVGPVDVGGDDHGADRQQAGGEDPA